MVYDQPVSAAVLTHEIYFKKCRQDSSVEEPISQVLGADGAESPHPAPMMSSARKDGDNRKVRDKILKIFSVYHFNRMAIIIERTKNEINPFLRERVYCAKINT